VTFVVVVDSIFLIVIRRGRMKRKGNVFWRDKVGPRGQAKRIRTSVLQNLMDSGTFSRLKLTMHRNVNTIASYDGSVVYINKFIPQDITIKQI
jgi:hypothetical protein